MIIQQIYITVKPSFVNDFIEYTKDNVMNSNKEPGVKRFECFKDRDSDNRFVLFEIFNTADDRDKHRETAHYKRWKEKTADLLESPYSRTEFDYVKTD
jgi:(4S)-4-hydroxy-5-phosphonooxypentane-2,3-dione isomerase